MTRGVEAEGLQHGLPVLGAAREVVEERRVLSTAPSIATVCLDVPRHLEVNGPLGPRYWEATCKLSCTCPNRRYHSSHTMPCYTHNSIHKNLQFLELTPVQVEGLPERSLKGTASPTTLCSPYSPYVPPKMPLFCVGSSCRPPRSNQGPLLKGLGIFQ